MINVTVPNVGVLQFPDGTGEDQIISEIRAKYPDHPDLPPLPGPAAATPKPPELPSWIDDSMRKRAEADPRIAEAAIRAEQGSSANQRPGFISGLAASASDAAVRGFGNVKIAADRVMDVAQEALLPGFREDTARRQELISQIDPDAQPSQTVRRIIEGRPEQTRRSVAEIADPLSRASKHAAGPQILKDVAGAVGSTVPAIAGFGLGGPAIGLPVVAAQQFGDTYTQAVDYYRNLGFTNAESESIATKLGATTGTATALLTRYIPKGLQKIPGVGKYLGEGVEDVLRRPVLNILIDKGWKESAKEALLRVGGDMTSEAIEEGSQQLLNAAIDMKSSRPDLSWQGAFEESFKAALLGGATAGIFRGARGAVDAVRNAPEIRRRIQASREGLPDGVWRDAEGNYRTDTRPMPERGPSGVQISGQPASGLPEGFTPREVDTSRLPDFPPPQPGDELIVEGSAPVEQGLDQSISPSGPTPVDALINDARRQPATPTPTPQPEGGDQSERLQEKGRQERLLTTTEQVSPQAITGSNAQVTGAEMPVQQVGQTADAGGVSPSPQPGPEEFWNGAFQSATENGLSVNLVDDEGNSTIKRLTGKKAEAALKKQRALVDTLSAIRICLTT